MEAHPRKLKYVFRQDVRLEVPLFQRRYVWTEVEQWEPLWEDVLATWHEMRGEDWVPHFMGAIVLEHVPRPLGAIEVRQVIDGQQRLTTMQLLTAAVREAAKEVGASTRTLKRLGTLLRNDDDLVEGDDDAYKLWPTNSDRGGYRGVLDGDFCGTRIAPPNSGRIVEAYLWFRTALAQWLESTIPPDRAERIDELAEVLLDGLEVVVIDLGPDDNAQVIFETLNARGTPLLASDLIKNLIFRTLQDFKRPSERLYEQHWKPLEEDAWQTKVRQGRLVRPRLDAFVGYFLVVLMQRQVQSHQLFTTFREHIGRDPDRAEQVLKELSRYAQVYDRLERREDVTPGEAAALQRMQIADTQTVQPLLLWLWANHRGPDRERAVQVLESYLVRRTICRLTSKNYNLLFLELLRRLTNGEGQPGQFISDFLAAQGSDSGVWPGDGDLQRAIVTFPVYKSLKKVRVNRILLALEEQARGPRTEPLQLTKALSVEHLMPQHWQEHWPLPPGTASSDAAAERESLIHTLGNLTLVTQPLNSALSNGTWAHKREEILRSSALTLNRSLPFEFDDAAVQRRGHALAELAQAAWPRPAIPGGQSRLVEDREQDLRPERDASVGRALRRQRTGSSGRRDIGAHIQFAFRDLPVGTFLTVSKIQHHLSPEYGANLPSAGAISARLFPKSGRMTVPGVTADQRNGLRGATKIDNY